MGLRRLTVATVQLKTLAAGPQGVKQPGEHVEVPAHIAEHLVTTGQAEHVAAERAVMPKRETRGRRPK